ncbi:MAG: hypothetical protein JNK64_35420, partial [Myxococcales bacterium]|nr:hypothetical protein [Myxococcales bacterium]
MRWIVALVAVAGCFRPDEHRCALDDDCGLGTCVQATGYCAFVDDTCCVGSLRYGGGAGPLANACVFDEPCLDAAGPDAPPDVDAPPAVIDAPPPDAPPAGVAHLDPADAVVGAADLRVMTGTVTIDTSALTISGISGSGVTVVAAAQVPAGPELAVLRLDALGVASGATLKAIGTRPLVIVARTASIDGTLTASAVGSVPGAGGAAAAMGPGRGLSGATASDNDGGGGGAGHGAAGGRGGA